MSNNFLRIRILTADVIHAVVDNSDCDCVLVEIDQHKINDRSQCVWIDLFS